MEDESQIEIKDIRLLGQLITKMNPTYLELLYTPYYLINKDFQRVPTTLLYNQLKKMRDELSNADVARLLKAMNGFVSQKYKDIEKDTEASHHFIEEYKYNPKQFHHLMRLSYMIDRIIRLQGKIDFYELMTLEFLTKSQKKQLKNYKTSPIDYVDAMKIATEHQLKNRELIDTFLNKQQCPKNQEILDTLETKINDYVLLCIKKEVIKSIKQHNTKNK